MTPPPTASTPHIPGADPPAPSPRSRGVLVVDDDDHLRRLLARGMRLHGFAVWLAAGGREAIELYCRHRDAIDVVLLDVRMPERDGPETAVALRELDPKVRFCFMSGETGKYTEEGLKALGAAFVCQKPFRIAELADKLRSAVAPIEWRNDFSVSWHGSFEEQRWEDDGGPVRDLP